MKTFLEYVAEDILRKHGNQLSRVAVVFPNKRASLFLSDHLARLTSQPLWSPAYVTISDLFRQHSTLTVADPVKLVCDLHKSFTLQTGIDETLDHFYGWGQLLLADFDDLDKNLGEADKIFANLRDIHELDGVSYLSDEQKAVIRRFFSNFADDHNSKLKERFLKLWSRLADIYHDYNRRLRSQGLAYEGALYREVACTDGIGFRYDHYIFVGFNMLQRTEQRLFATLRQQGRASFYWDLDHYYMGHEAGHYIGQYLAAFPNELDLNRDDIYRCFSQPKAITFVKATTENIQARFMADWLREHRRYADGRRTAVVLCDEKLLTTAIHCLPDEVQSVNVTTGYPLSQSPVASLVALLFALQTTGRSGDRFRLHQVNAVLRHPFIASLAEECRELRQTLTRQKIYYPTPEQLCTLHAAPDGLHPAATLFRQVQGNDALLRWLCDIIQLIAQGPAPHDVLDTEALFHTYTLANRLLGLVESGDLQVDVVTLQRLFGQLVQTTSIPFHGEPAEGVQLMGVLETRNLDFDHVLLLSCNEGNMPKGVGDASLIPYNLRKAYGLTTIDHKVSIFSYYFHRLLSRAHDVTLVYNGATTDGSTGEMSRFMLQLQVECPHPIRRLTLQSGQSFTPFAPPTFDKTPAVMDALRSRFARQEQNALTPLLTPTAINRYMRCPVSFYYNYVEGLRQPEDNDEDTIDNRVFGNIFHEASRIVYTRLMQKSHQILAADIDALLRTGADIERAVDEALRTELFQLKTAGKLPELNGLQIINREVIIHYLRQLLVIDRRLAPFTIRGLETDVTATMDAGPFTTTIGGRIDRLDQVGNTIRVIDYKTGGGRLKPLPSVEAIFQDEQLGNHSDYYLQAFVYSCIVRYRSLQPVSPALLFIQHASADDYDPTLFLGKEPVSDIASVQQPFGELLSQKVGEMFNPAIPFTPTADRSRCRLCPYLSLCSIRRAT